MSSDAHPDPENAVSTCLQELGELYNFDWHNVHGRRSTDELARKADELTKWVREVKAEIAPIEQFNQRQYEDAIG